MSETPALVFKATNPEHIKASTAEREKVYADFQATVEALSVELGGRDLSGIDHFAGGFTLTSYRMNSVSDLLPGWRRDGASMRAVPAKRTPEGKEWAKRLAAVTLADRVVPGFPSTMRCDGFALYPQLEEIGGEYSVTISMKPRDQYLEMIDTDLWVPTKMSEYFLALEAAETNEKETS